ncbi:thioredoxin-like [Aquarana catesbeiana]|uniref:thioredoxin-like n=1 Tax=Aquarana catesbeiana TaxID=8400 RepID=UPI003CC9BD8E
MSVISVCVYIGNSESIYCSLISASKLSVETDQRKSYTKIMEKISDQQRLQQIVNDAGNKLIVVMFMNKNCPHCRRALPWMEKLALEKTLVIFVRIDVGENPGVVREYDIRAVPECFFIKTGAMRERIAGADQKTVENKIQELSG